MKLKCNTLVLNEAIMTAGKVAVSGAFSQVTGGVMIEAKDSGVVKLTCNNLETSIEYEFTAEVKEKGLCVVPARLFGDIVKNFTAEETTIEVEGKWSEGAVAKIVCGKGKFDISMLNPEEFPPVPKAIAENEVSINAETFKGLVKGTAFSTAITDTRAMLTGCLIEMEKDRVRMVGLDGFRMGLRDAKTKEKVKDKMSVVIPAKSLNEFCKIVGDFDGDIKMGLSDKHATFTVGDMVYKTKRINGEYIDYKITMTEPVGETTEFDVDTKELIRAIERAAVVVVNDQMKKSIKMEIKDGGIKFTCESVVGKSEEFLAVENMKGAGLVIGFNHRFILDAAKNIPVEKVHVRMETKLTPCVLTATEKATDGTDFFYTIFPVRT